MSSLENRDLRKRIDEEQKFAEYVYTDFRHKRFGIDSINITEQLDKYWIKKQLNYKTDYSIKTYIKEYESEGWTILENPNPPGWLEANCQNACVIPPIFTPNQLQLDNTGGIWFFGAYGSPGGDGPINNSVVVNKMFFENFPNESLKAEITISSRVAISQMYIASTFAGLYGEDPMGLQAVVPFYCATLTPEEQENCPSYGSDLFNDVLGPSANPTYVGTSNNAGNYPDLFRTCAQFQLRPKNGDLENIIPHFRYKDPNLVSPTTMTDEDGNIWWYDAFAGTTENNNDIFFTIFGNTVKDYRTDLGSINGALWYWQSGNATLSFEGTNEQFRFANSDGNSTYISKYLPPNNENELQQMFEYPEQTSVGNTTDYLSIQWTGQPEFFNYCSFFPGNGSYVYGWGQGVVTDIVGFPLESALGASGTGGYSTQYEAPNWNDTGDLGEVLSFTPCEIPGIDPDQDCTEDIETIVFSVVDQNDTPIENYEIVLDGKQVGYTDNNGRFTTTIKNASEITKHTIDICHCFETVGWCSQRYIKITRIDNDIEDPGISKISCIPIS